MCSHVSFRGNVRALLVITGLVLSTQFTQGAGVAFQTGDVLAGVGTGKIKHFRPDGTLVDTLDTGTSCAEQLGMGFKTNGHLLATSSFGSCFGSGRVVEFDNFGNLVGSFGGPYSSSTESIAVDSSGNVYVGQPDGTRQVLKFSSSGALLRSYSPQSEDRGTDWIDLASDQCTLHYTSEGDHIKQFNVCANSQLADFATGLSGPCFAHRIRPNAEELVACASRAYRLSSSGSVMQTYVLPGASFLFALNLDPDNKTFWTADYGGGIVFRVDIATGATVTQFNANKLTELSGLAVVGEITAANSAPLPTTTYYVRTTNSTTLRNAGHDLAQRQLAGTAAQDSIVALLFGAPYCVGGQSPDCNGGQYGVSLFNAGPVPLSTGPTNVAALAEAFASGYYNALVGNSTAHLRIALVTSSSTTQCGGNQVTFGHGRAWANMVNDVSSWVITSRYVGQVDIAAGNDMEAGAEVWGAKAYCGAAGKPMWASKDETRSWVDGYASVFPRRFLYDVGDAGGCPQSGTTAIPGHCNDGWTQDDVRYVSWGSPPAEPLPEIYYASQAAQWQQLSLYSYLKYGASMIIAGTLTEYGSDTSTNTPGQGWQLLYTKLNNDTRTRQILDWSTDIKSLY